MTDAADKPFDIVAALAFVFGAAVIAASLGSLLLTLLAVARLAL